jgi:hypothetical protein
MKRPWGVAVLAVVNVLEAVLLVLVAGMVALLVWAAGQGAFQGAEGELPASSRRLLEALAWLSRSGLLWAAVGFLLVLAAVYLALGVGLWKLRNWARLGTLGLSALRVPLALVGLGASLLSFDPTSAVLQALMLFVYGWIVWYLLQRDVRLAFGGVVFEARRR